MFTIRRRQLEKKRLDAVLADSDFLTVLDRDSCGAAESSGAPALAYVAGAIFSMGTIRVEAAAVVFIQKPTAG